MGKLPAIQWYPNDWQNDMGVQSLTFEERGIWWEILQRMHQSEHRGKMVLNGVAMSDEEIARIIHCDLAKLKQTLKQILSKGVASLDDKKCLYNRRMVNDDKLRNSRAQSGALGGKQKASNALANTVANSTPSSSSSSSTSLKTTTTTSPNGDSATAEKGVIIAQTESQNPVHKLDRAWKRMLELPEEEWATWDRANFGRVSKSAKLLLEICKGDIIQAADCMGEVYHDLKAKDLNCTLETVVKKSHEWRIANGKTSVEA